MRYQGKVTNWKDDQGFGFVTPNGGGQKAFVHISAFSKRSNRPVENDLITYELATDETGRFYAKDIRFVGEVSPLNFARKARWFLTIVSFCVLLYVVTISQQPALIVKVYTIVALVTFVVYALDKAAAKSDRWRTPESTLHVLALVGGWPGAMLAQTLLRHKSVKREFRLIFWITVVVNLLVLGWLVSH